MIPLTYYWKVEYKDGKTISQYDANGIEHLWGQVNLSQVKKFSWLPFSKAFAEKVNGNYANMAQATENKPYAIELEPGEEIVAFRRNFLTSKGEHTIIYCAGTNRKTVAGVLASGEIQEEL